MNKLAFYDMDKTITRRATLTPFLFYACFKVTSWRLLLLPVVVLAGLGYVLKWLDRKQLKELNLRLLLGRVMPLDLVSGFAQQTLARNVLAGARAQIAADRAAGYTLVLATASCRFYAEAIAAQLGFDAVIATENEHLADGRVSARIAGENCYGSAKLAMVQTWMAAQGIARDTTHIRFYSDHISDAPCLDYADEAFAVNAHPPLRALAVEKGWAVVDWA